MQTMDWRDELKKAYEYAPPYLHQTEKEIAKGIWLFFEGRIESLLKEQREICEKEYLKEKDYEVRRTIISTKILNVPEPSGKSPIKNHNGV